VNQRKKKVPAKSSRQRRKASQQETKVPVAAVRLDSESVRELLEAQEETRRGNFISGNDLLRELERT
jgi:hypothetical protein